MDDTEFIKEPWVEINLYDGNNLLVYKQIIKCDGVANTLTWGKKTLDGWMDDYKDYEEAV